MLQQIMRQQEEEERAPRATKIGKQTRASAEAKLGAAVASVVAEMRRFEFDPWRIKAAEHCLMTGQYMPDMHDGEWMEKKLRGYWSADTNLYTPPRYPSRSGRPIYTKIKGVDFVYRYLGSDLAYKVVEAGVDLQLLGGLGDCLLGNAGWDGKTLLLDAATAGMCDQIDLLLSAGATVDYTGPPSSRAIEKGPTPLIAACAGSHLDAVERLLAAGDDPNACPPLAAPHTATPLHAALSAREYTEGILERLAIHGADFDLAAKVGAQPFYIYAHAEQLAVLVHLGVEIDAPMMVDFTAKWIEHAVLTGEEQPDLSRYRDMMRFLAERGASLEEVNPEILILCNLV